MEPTTTPPPAYPTASQRGRSTRLADVPLPIWLGLGLGALAFVVRFSVFSSSSENGVRTSCSYVDLFGFIAAAGLVACVITAWTVRAGMHPARRLTPALMYAASAVLIALAVVHVLRGTGTVGGKCG